MLTNCSNPDCHEKFKYLGEGRLFLANPAEALNLNEQQLFERCSWLCTRCAKIFEIHYQAGKPKLVRREMRRAANL